MATFKDQLDNFRIKTLAQDVLQQPNSVGQYWDTLGLEVSEIAAANFWDLTMRPLQTNDVIMARIHGADDDSAILGEMRFLSAYCKLINPRQYVSHLLPIYAGFNYAVADIANANLMTEYTEKTISLLSPMNISDIYVYLDGKISEELTVYVGMTGYTFEAGSSYGEVLHWDNYPAASGSSIQMAVESASGNTSPVNLHIVAVVNPVLPVIPTIDLTSNVTGVLPTANGGTGASSFPSINLASGVTGVLPAANGGTGLDELGQPGDVFKMNEEGTAAEWGPINTDGGGDEEPPQG